MRLTIDVAEGRSTTIGMDLAEVGYAPSRATILIELDSGGGTGTLELSHPEAVILINDLMRAVNTHKRAAKARAEAGL